MSEWTEKLADRISEAFGEPTLIPDEVKAVLWDINSEAWARGVIWSRMNGSILPASEVNPYRKPPLVLPTEPTWGIPIAHGCPQNMSQWYTQASFLESLDGNRLTTYNVTDFIPLTDEQVKRIEAADER